MVWLAEIRLRFKGLVRPFMLGVFGSVVISECLAQTLWKARKPTNERVAHFTSRLVFELRDLRVSRLAFNAYLESGLALPRHSRVCFPMPRDPSPLDRLGALGDGNSIGNMGLSVFSGVPPPLPFLVSTNQIWD